MLRTFVFVILVPVLAAAGEFSGKWEGEVVSNAGRVPFRIELTESPARVCFFEDTDPVCSTTASIEGKRLTAKWDYLNCELTLTAADGVLTGTYVNLRTKRETKIEVRRQAAANFA